MAPEEPRSASDDGPVPRPVVLVSGRTVVGSDDSGRFAAEGEAFRAHTQDSADPSGAQGVGAIGDALGEAAYKTRDVVEPALARALVLAAEAARWELVAQIAKERQFATLQPLPHLGERTP